MICSTSRRIQVVLILWGIVWAGGSLLAQSSQCPPFWTAPGEFLGRQNLEGVLLEAEPIRSAWADDPEISLLPPVWPDREGEQDSSWAGEFLFLDNFPQGEPVLGPEGNGGERFFYPPPEMVGWSQLPPPDWTEEELAPWRRLRYRRRVQAQTRLLFQNIREDHLHFYSWPTIRDMGLGLALGAVFANTSLDQHFQDWYQDNVHSRGLDRLSTFWKPWGEGSIFIPAYVGLGLLEVFCPERPVLGPVGRFGARVSRSYLVGAPPLLFLQAMTGGGRPVDPQGSSWRPFDDVNGISGHAFIGAVPFLTAAQMTDRPLLQAAFYLGSVFPVWSRLDDGAHYLSQVCLGWWLAYLACRAVHQTETGQKPWTLLPISGGNQIGLGIVWTR